LNNSFDTSRGKGRGKESGVAGVQELQNRAAQVRKRAKRRLLVSEQVNVSLLDEVLLANIELFH
jgi:hypothetical protein